MAKSPTNKQESKPKTEYKAEYKTLAKQAMMLGMSFQDIAEGVFNTTEENMKQWMVEYPDFANALKEGGEKADLLVVDSLHQIATGMNYVEEAICPGEGVVEINRYLPPNINAIKYWLNNRKAEKWQNKNNNNLSGEVKGGVALVVIDNDDEDL